MRASFMPSRRAAYLPRIRIAIDGSVVDPGIDDDEAVGWKLFRNRTWQLIRVVGPGDRLLTYTVQKDDIPFSHPVLQNQIEILPQSNRLHNHREFCPVILYTPFYSGGLAVLC